jgi:hypothetical protein
LQGEFRSYENHTLVLLVHHFCGVLNKREWKFLDELKDLNVSQVEQQKRVVSSMQTQHGRRVKNLRSEEREANDAFSILRMRLANGEITKDEYNELYNAIS